MNLIIKFIKIFAVSIVLFFVFALLSYFLPDSIVKNNINKTVFQTDLAFDYPFAVIPAPAYYMDNFTDALILNQAYCVKSNKPFKSIMLLPSEHSSSSPCKNLSSAVYNGISDTMEYPRYWHGSTFVARFLLLFGPYTYVRAFLYFVTSFLIFALSLVLYKKSGIVSAVSLPASLILVNVFVMQFSLQFFFVLAISLIAGISVSFNYTNTQKIFLIFFISGILTAFFDLLTAPMLVLGLPLLCFALLKHKKGQTMNFLSALKEIILISIVWTVGYAFCWASKWIIAFGITGKNVLNDAMNQASFRADTQEGFSRWDAVSMNLQQINWIYILVLTIIVFIIAIRYFKKSSLPLSVLFLAISLLPFLWYFILANHSYQHYWFAYRSLAVCLLGIMLSLCNLIDWERLCKDCKDKVKLFFPKNNCQ